MFPRLVTSLGVTALTLGTSAFVLIRMRRKHDALIRLRRDLLLHETKLKIEVSEALLVQPNRRETWYRPIQVEIRRLDFNIWRDIQIGEKSELVLSQIWPILEWLRIRSNPLFAEFVEASEKTGTESHRRISALKGSKDLTQEGNIWLEKELKKSVAEEYGHILKTMKEYRKLREQIGLQTKPLI